MTPREKFVEDLKSILEAHKSYNSFEYAVKRSINEEALKANLQLLKSEEEKRIKGDNAFIENWAPKDEPEPDSFHDSLSKATADLIGKERKIIDDFCKAYVSEKLLEGHTIPGLISKLCVVEEPLTVEGGRLGKKYYCCITDQPATSARYPSVPLYLKEKQEKTNISQERVASSNISRRDYLAAAALNGLLLGGYPVSNGSNWCEEHALDAVKFADALINELDKDDS